MMPPLAETPHEFILPPAKLLPCIVLPIVFEIGATTTNWITLTVAQWAADMMAHPHEVILGKA